MKKLTHELEKLIKLNIDATITRAMLQEAHDTKGKINLKAVQTLRGPLLSGLTKSINSLLEKETVNEVRIHNRGLVSDCFEILVFKDKMILGIEVGLNNHRGVDYEPIITCTEITIHDSIEVGREFLKDVIADVYSNYHGLGIATLESNVEFKEEILKNKKENEQTLIKYKCISN